MKYYFCDSDLLPEIWPRAPKDFGVIGGSLSPDYLKDAYAKGYFPWFEHDDFPVWFNPDPRCVLYPNQVKVSKSMRNVLNQKKFVVKHNVDFRRVMQHCATVKRNDGNSTWISDRFIENYTLLHQMGIAHSVETYMEGELVGGLYYLKFGRVMAGESMFSLVSNASKVALIHLCQLATAQSVTLIDCQVSNPHLISLGAEEIPRKTFLTHLNAAAKNYG